jgi:hypothetical protein
VTEDELEEFRGIYFPFKEKNTGEIAQATSHKETVWDVKTGDMVPGRDKDGKEAMVDQIIYWPYDKFFDVFEPASYEAAEFAIACLENVAATYDRMSELIYDQIDKFDEMEFEEK